MKVLIYTEDAYNELPAELAKRILKKHVPGAYAEAAQGSIGEWKDKEELKRLVQEAATDGCDCVIFLIDREGSEFRSPGRPKLLRDICTAFQQLCQEGIAGNVRVALVIASPCIESWLLGDVDGLIEYARGPKGPHRFTGKGFSRCPTDQEDNPQTCIQELFNQVAKDTGSRPKTYQKSQQREIAQHIDPDRICNKSFHYFRDFLLGKVDGCDDPCQQLRSKE